MRIGILEMQKDWKIKKTKFKRIVIECSMDLYNEAIAYLYGHGYKASGWSGPALNKDKNGPTYDQNRYHIEGEKKIR